MTWKAGTLKVNPANTVFEGFAVFTKDQHESGLEFYSATLTSGAKLTDSNLTRLGQSVVTAISNGAKRNAQ